MESFRRSIVLMALAALTPVVGVAGIEGTRAGITRGQEICLVDDLKVQPNFRDAFVQQVNAKGYPTRFVTATSTAEPGCPVAMTFTATYAMSGGYRRVLKISTFRVLRDGEQIAAVNFRFSHAPFGNGSVEEVIGKMLDVLLP